MADKIKLFLTNPNKIDLRTHVAFDDNPSTRFRAPSQYWKWAGGDAIVVPAGILAFVIIRQGDQVGTYQAAGLRSALSQCFFTRHLEFEIASTADHVALAEAEAKERK